MMNKKTLIAISLVAIFLVFVGYFFMPKTSTNCADFGDGPSFCKVCTCSMGIVFGSMTIGGNLEPNCFMGKLLECKNIDVVK